MDPEKFSGSIILFVGELTEKLMITTFHIIIITSFISRVLSSNFPIGPTSAKTETIAINNKIAKIILIFMFDKFSAMIYQLFTPLRSNRSENYNETCYVKISNGITYLEN